MHYEILLFLSEGRIHSLFQALDLHNLANEHELLTPVSGTEVLPFLTRAGRFLSNL